MNCKMCGDFYSLMGNDDGHHDLYDGCCSEECSYNWELIQWIEAEE